MSVENHKAKATRLTIMQVLPALRVGGVERGTVEFAIFLKQQGHRPIIVSEGGALESELNKHEITHVNITVGKKSLRSLLSIKKLRRLMMQEQVDVVHARSRLPAWLCYWAIRRIKNTAKPKFVTTLHGLHSVNRYSSIMARGEAVIAVSNTAKKYLLEHFNDYLKAEPILIYRGVSKQFHYKHNVPPEWLIEFNNKVHHCGNPSENFKTVLLPGRMTHVKGAEHLMPWLETTPHDCKLLFTAEPNESNYSQRIHQLIEQRQLSARVVWLGMERDMPSLYASVDLVVSVNNKGESFGRTVLEALTIGTPVVAFSHGGVSEIMSELFSQGQIIPGDDKSLAARIDAFLADPPHVKVHQSFSNQTLFQKTLSVYYSLLPGKVDQVEVNRQ